MARMGTKTEIKFGKPTEVPVLECSSTEYFKVKKRFDSVESMLGNNLDFFENLGLYDQAFALYDKLTDIGITIPYENEPNEPEVL